MPLGEYQPDVRRTLPRIPVDLVAPEAQDLPARRGQYLCLLRVALDVSVQLCLPIAGVGCRASTALWAAVPKTAIHENRDMWSCEDKIRLRTLDPDRAPPAAYSDRPQAGCQALLKRRSFARNGCHRATALKSFGQVASGRRRRSRDDQAFTRWHRRRLVLNPHLSGLQHT